MNIHIQISMWNYLKRGYFLGHTQQMLRESLLAVPGNNIGCWNRTLIGHVLADALSLVLQLNPVWPKFNIVLKLHLFFLCCHFIQNKSKRGWVRARGVKQPVVPWGCSWWYRRRSKLSLLATKHSIFELWAISMAPNSFKWKFSWKDVWMEDQVITTVQS